LSKLLAEKGIRHEVLNAKNHEREAQIVALAGERGAVTVATNMAGRGTDIKLGGNFEHRLATALEERGLFQGDLEHLAEIDAVRAEVRARCDKDEKEVLALGGLYVLGTERHEARRIDNQLRGRSGRQGNAGVSRFYLSLEDDLMRIFYRDWVKNAMARLGMTEDTPIESGMVARAIAKAQKKVEERNFEIRKSLLEYDEVMNEQRKEIYGTRQDVLEGVEVREKVRMMLQRVVERAATRTHHLDAAGFRTWFQRSFGREVELDLATRATQKNGDHAPVAQFLLALHDEREAQLSPEFLRRVETYLLMKAIDDKWRDHLSAIDALKAGIGLRGYGQVDPKNEYKREGFELFGKLFEAIEDEVTSLVMRIEVQRPPEGAQPAQSAPRYISPAPRVAAPSQPAKPAPQQPAAPREAPTKPASAPQSDARPASTQGAPAQRPPQRPAAFPLGGPGLPASRAFDIARRSGAAPRPKPADDKGKDKKPGG
jgi:preprotein translocase subunit SecA